MVLFWNNRLEDLFHRPNDLGSFGLYLRPAVVRFWTSETKVLYYYNGFLGNVALGCD